MIPPLITCVTYNIMGLSIIALNSILNTNNDFELYILDNASKDYTWDWLQTLKDPRIKCKKRFEKNIGGASAINWALLNRKKDQDFINIDRDVNILDENFVENFKIGFNLFPDIGILGGYVTSYDREPFKTELANKVKSGYIKKINNQNMVIYKNNEGVVGTFFSIKSSVMNKLGYYDEASMTHDYDLSQRIISGLKYYAGSVEKIRWQHANDIIDCNDCVKKQNVCNKISSKKNLYCKSFYVCHHFNQHIESFQKRQKIVELRISGKLPIYCDTIHSDSCKDDWYITEAKENIQYYSKRS